LAEEETMTKDKKLQRLEQLKKEHRDLDNQVQKEYSIRLDVSDLKVQKLRLKQEILAMEKELGLNE
jgi:hypothetical protein